MAGVLPDLGTEGMHPIVPELLALLVRGDEEPFVFAKSTLDALCDSLLAMGANERPRAVQDLVKLAFMLETQSNLHKASAGILAIIEESAQTLREGGRGLAARAGERNSSAGRRFVRFAGTSSAVAPKVGAKAPEGSLKAARLRPVRI